MARRQGAPPGELAAGLQAGTARRRRAAARTSSSELVPDRHSGFRSRAARRPDPADANADEVLPAARISATATTPLMTGTARHPTSSPTATRSQRPLLRHVPQRRRPAAPAPFSAERDLCRRTCGMFTHVHPADPSYATSPRSTPGLLRHVPPPADSSGTACLGAASRRDRRESPTRLFHIAASTREESGRDSV